MNIKDIFTKEGNRLAKFALNFEFRQGETFELRTVIATLKIDYLTLDTGTALFLCGFISKSKRGNMKRVSATKKHYSFFDAK